MAAKSRLGDGGMAIGAIDAEVPGVQFVAVGDGLRRSITDLDGGRERQITRQSGAADRQQSENGRADADVLVGCLWEDQSHVSILMSSSSSGLSFFYHNKNLSASARMVTAILKYNG